MSNIDNPRAVVGDNSTAYGENVLNGLKSDYPGLEAEVADALDEARALPAKIDSTQVMAAYGPVMKRLRDLAKRMTGFHQAEKANHLEAGRRVDGFFFGFIDKVAKRDKKANPGAADVLQKRVDEYVQKMLAEEEERRRLLAAEQARIAQAAIEEANRLAREAEETRLAAERARKPETIAAKAEVADQAEQVASSAAAVANAAEQRAYDAHMETKAKPADMVRQRSEGSMLTAGNEKIAEVVDAALLDKAALWPYISLAEKEKALRAWAKSTGYVKKMDGAEIGQRAKGRVI